MGRNQPVASGREWPRGRPFVIGLYSSAGTYSSDLIHDVARDLIDMTPRTSKQEIYAELLSSTLIYLRNTASFPFWLRWRNRSVYCELELIHNLPNSMFLTDFVEHDIWFLNIQARHYYSNASSKISPLYTSHLALISKLFSIVPPAMRNQLQWAGP